MYSRWPYFMLLYLAFFVIGLNIGAMGSEALHLKLLIGGILGTAGGAAGNTIINRMCQRDRASKDN